MTGSGERGSLLCASFMQANIGIQEQKRGKTNARQSVTHTRNAIQKSTSNGCYRESPYTPATIAIRVMVFVIAAVLMGYGGSRRALWEKNFIERILVAVVRCIANSFYTKKKS